MDTDAGDILDNKSIQSEPVKMPESVPHLFDNYEIIEGGNNRKGVSYHRFS